MATADGQLDILQAAAARLGIATAVVQGSNYPLARQPHAWLQLQFGERRYYYARGILLDGARPLGGALGQPINGGAATILRDKHRTKALLAAAGLPVPPGHVYGRNGLAALLHDAAALGPPFCVKPNNGRKGQLVFPELRDAAGLETAFRRVAAEFAEILLERSIPGGDYRFFYVQPRVVGVKFGTHGSVTGDGRRSLRDLVEARNAERRRRELPGHPPMALGAELDAVLADQGLQLATVPALGQLVLLARTSNGLGEGEAIACADRIHPGYAAVAEAACRAIPGLLLCGLDLKLQDPMAAPAPANHWLLELNAAPSLEAFHYPWEGPVQDVAAALLALLQRHATA